jgi:hypothetical protein
MTLETHPISPRGSINRECRVFQLAADHSRRTTPAAKSASFGSGPQIALLGYSWKTQDTSCGNTGSPARHGGEHPKNNNSNRRIPAPRTTFEITSLPRRYDKDSIVESDPSERAPLRVALNYYKSNTAPRNAHYVGLSPIDGQKLSQLKGSDRVSSANSWIQHGVQWPPPTWTLK